MSRSHSECDDTEKDAETVSHPVPACLNITIVNTSSYTVVQSSVHSQLAREWEIKIQVEYEYSVVSQSPDCCPLSRNGHKTFMRRIVISYFATLT